MTQLWWLLNETNPERQQTLHNQRPSEWTMNADRLTSKSQEAFSAAVSKANTDGSPQVDPLHLLAALLEQPEGIAVPLLEAVGADVAGIRSQTDQALAPLPKARGSSVGPPTLSRQLSITITTAETQAA